MGNLQALNEELAIWDNEKSRFCDKILVGESNGNETKCAYAYFLHLGY